MTTDPVSKSPVRRELVIVALLFLALTIILGAYKLARIDQMQGDSAAFFQATENVARRGIPVSQIQADLASYFFGPGTFVTTPPKKLASDPNAFARPAPEAERSLFLGHAYYILYPISIFVHLFSVRAVLMLVYASSFCGMVFLTYWMLRVLRVPVAASAAFCLFILMQPSWSEGMLSGQFYPDRIFLFAGFAFMFCASTPQTTTKLTILQRRLLLLAAAVLCSLVNERGGLSAGMFLLAYIVLFWRSPANDSWFKVALGVLLMGYGIFILKFVIPTNAYYGSFLPTSLAGLKYTIEQPNFFPTAGLFVLVCLPLLAFAFGNVRAALIALFMMLPNIFGNIGGAEKLGWSTHYQSFVFPALVWAGITGFAEIHTRVRLRGRAPILWGTLAAAMLFICMLDPYSYTKISIQTSNIQRSVIPRLLKEIPNYLGAAGSQLHSVPAQMRLAVPEHSTVSAVQAAMAMLYHDRDVQFFPVNIDNADYVVLGAQGNPGNYSYSGAESYLGTDAQVELERLVLARLKTDGYDLDHPVMFPLVGLAVVKRIAKTPAH